MSPTFLIFNTRRQHRCSRHQSCPKLYACDIIRASLSIFDPDDPFDSKFIDLTVSCRCSNKNFSTICDPFFINYTSDQIATLSIKENIDYEVAHLISCKITALDLNAFSDDSGQDNSVKFSVTILNENDNIPTPLSSLYIFNVSENTPIGSSFGQIEAFDLDGDEIRYSVVSQFIQINSNGVLSLKNHIDYEELGFKEKKPSQEILKETGR